MRVMGHVWPARSRTTSRWKQGSQARALEELNDGRQASMHRNSTCHAGTTCSRVLGF